MRYATNLSNVIFWNVWGHRCPQAVHLYIEQHKEADIICLTEVLDGKNTENGTSIHTSTRLMPPANIDGLKRLQNDFGDVYHIAYKAPSIRNWTCTKTRVAFPDIGFGSALLYRKSLELIAIGDQVTSQFEEAHFARVLQWIVYEKNGERYLVAHIHGMWFEDNSKGDHPLRLEQSKEILHHLTLLSSKYEVDKIVFGGDLNLAIDTEALLLLQIGYEGSIALRNHIKERGIKSTRTIWYRKFKDATASKHADYVMSTAPVSMILVCADVYCLGSDHAPIRCSFC